jgi:inner membrane protein
MFLFAHVGITLGAATLISGAVDRIHALSKEPANPAVSDFVKKKRSFSEFIGLKSLSEFIDIRLLLIGSLFPDIIDKPLAALGFGNGRSITHTLLVTLVFLVIGVYIYLNHKKTWLLAIVTGMIAHLILDSMWGTPETLLWPIYGWSFPASGTYPGLDQFSIWWNGLKTNLSEDIFEGIGLAVLAVTTLALIGQKELKSLLLKGKIETG